METDGKDREAPSPTPIAFRRAEVPNQKATLHSGIMTHHPPTLTLSWVNSPNQLWHPLALHGVGMTSVPGGESGGSHRRHGCREHLSYQRGDFFPQPQSQGHALTRAGRSPLGQSLLEENKFTDNTAGLGYRNAPGGFPGKTRAGLRWKC